MKGICFAGGGCAAALAALSKDTGLGTKRIRAADGKGCGGGTGCVGVGVVLGTVRRNVGERRHQHLGLDCGAVRILSGLGWQLSLGISAGGWKGRCRCSCRNNLRCAVSQDSWFVLEVMSAYK